MHTVDVIEREKNSRFKHTRSQANMAALKQGRSTMCSRDARPHRNKGRRRKHELFRVTTKKKNSDSRMLKKKKKEKVHQRVMEREEGKEEMGRGRH